MLQNKKIGFIGAGNMGSAIAGGLVSSGKVAAANLLITDIDRSKAEAFASCGAQVVEDAKTLAKGADVVVLAVKPQVMDSVLAELKGICTPLYVSIAAGLTIAHIKEQLDGPVRVVRVMPNTPALVNAGMSVVSGEAPATAEDVQMVRAMFESVGLVEEMPEKFINAVGSVSGSSPAFVYMMIEAMADGAVADGIPRAVAYKLAAQAVLGSAKMVLETGLHPGDLKDRVCSPGGTTIAAVASLERDGFRSAIIDAMDCCTKRSEQLTK